MLTPADLSDFDLSQPFDLYLPDEAATARLGALIAPHLKAGDIVYLTGELGMGKSSLARGLIRTLTKADQDVPSPTFTLIQAYETAGFDLLHLDLYRLETPDESYELGLDDALPHSVLLIEWPDRLGPLGYADRLDIVLQLADKTNFPHGRVAHLASRGNFRASV